MEDIQVLLQSTVKLETEVKEEQSVIHEDFIEECWKKKPSEQLQSLELPVKQEIDSEMEELKPPIAVWVPETTEIDAGEEEHPCAPRVGSVYDPLAFVKKDELVHSQDFRSPDRIEFQEHPEVTPDSHCEQCVAPNTTHMTEEPHSSCTCKCTISSLVNVVHKNHEEENLYDSSMHDVKVSDKAHFASHLETHRVGDTFAYSVCKMQFSPNPCLMDHNHLFGNLYTDYMCDKKFTQIEAHTGENPYACFLREMKIRGKSDLTTITGTHSGKKPYACPFCEIKFRLKSVLTTHIRTHTGEKPYACSFCEMKFRQKVNLTTHIRTHTGEKPYVCSFCEMKFRQKFGLTTHIRTHTGEKPFACSFCEMKFREKGTLTKHIRTHTGEKPFSCSLCEMKFGDKSKLVRHNRIHTGEKPFTCSLCEKKFREKGNLDNHIRIHTGEKPFACSLCEMKFRTQSHLAIHIRTHTGEKPFSCSSCEMKFRHKSALTSHILTHTGEKPFACPLCEMKFRTQSHLANHIRTHTGEKPFSCTSVK